MKSIVTGGAGFIGSHLVDALVARGDEVLVVDNFATGRPANLVQHKGSSQVSIAQRDIAKDPLTDLFQGADRVFHLAALADIVPSVQNPFAYHQANVDGTFAVLEAARHAGVKRFVYSASSSCYGIPDVYPTPESAAARPEYPYALSKYVGELYVLHWSKLYGIPAVSLRLFNVYGPRSRTSGSYGAVFGVFLAQKIAGKPFTVVGDGSQKRDFVFVTDVVDAFIRAADSDLTGAIMNVGTGSAQTVSRLVELLGGPITHIPKRPGEPDITEADITRITSSLGWKPKVSFPEGVAEMLRNLDLWREAPVWTAESIAEATKDWFTYLGGGEQK